MLCICLTITITMRNNNYTIIIIIVSTERKEGEKKRENKNDLKQHWGERTEKTLFSSRLQSDGKYVSAYQPSYIYIFILPNGARGNSHVLLACIINVLGYSTLSLFLSPSSSLYLSSLSFSPFSHSLSHSLSFFLSFILSPLSPSLSSHHTDAIDSIGTHLSPQYAQRAITDGISHVWQAGTCTLLGGIFMKLQKNRSASKIALGGREGREHVK